MGSELKDTNPKDAVGIAKAPLSVVSGPVISELGVAMFEGARKYGRHNWRVASVRASVYYDATFRHLVGWWEGEDTDPDSGVNHITKAIASLMVLRDAMIHDKWVDDRPPPSPAGWLKELNKKAAAVIERYPDAVDPVTHETQESTPKTQGPILYTLETCEHCGGTRCLYNTWRDSNKAQDTCTCESIALEIVSNPKCIVDNCMIRSGGVGRKCEYHIDVENTNGEA